MSLLYLPRTPCAAMCGNKVTTRTQVTCSICLQTFCQDCTLPCPSCTHLYNHYHRTQPCNKHMCISCLKSEDRVCICCDVRASCTEYRLHVGYCTSCQYCDINSVFGSSHYPALGVIKAKEMYSEN